MSNSEIPGDVRPHPTTDNTTGPSTAPKPPPGRKDRDGARILDRNDVPMAQVDSQGSRSGSSSSSPRKHTKEAKGPTEARNLNQPQTRENRTKITGQRGADAAPAPPKGQAQTKAPRSTMPGGGTGTNGKPDKLGTNNQQSIGMNMRPNRHLHMHNPRLNSHHVNPRVTHNPPKTRR